MDYTISIQINERYIAVIDSNIIRRAINQALNYVAKSDRVSLSVVFEDDEILHQLNNQYLGIDAPTDVLAFPAEYTDSDTGERYLGDILVSASRALEQAAEGNHPIEDELQLLVVHGVLHLLGYDHTETSEKEQMQSAQSAILHNLGCELKIVL